MLFKIRTPAVNSFGKIEVKQPKKCFCLITKTLTLKPQINLEIQARKPQLYNIVVIQETKKLT